MRWVRASKSAAAAPPAFGAACTATEATAPPATRVSWWASESAPALMAWWFIGRVDESRHFQRALCRSIGTPPCEKARVARSRERARSELDRGVGHLGAARGSAGACRSLPLPGADG